MKLKCCVDSCQSKLIYWNNQLHLFPLNSILRKKWVAAIKKVGKFKSLRNGSRICSKHFKQNDLIRSSLGDFKLKSEAFPSIFVKDLRSLFKVLDVDNIKNKKKNPISEKTEEMSFKKTLYLLVNYGVSTTEDLKARYEREKNWIEYNMNIYREWVFLKQEKIRMQRELIFWKNLYDDYQNGNLPSQRPPE